MDSSLRAHSEAEGEAIQKQHLDCFAALLLAMTRALGQFRRKPVLARFDRYHARNGLDCAGHLRGQFKPAGELDLHFRPFGKHQNEGYSPLAWVGRAAWHRAFKPLGHALERLLLADENSQTFGKSGSRVIQRLGRLDADPNVIPLQLR